MTNLFCVRAEFGTYTQHFVDGGYVAIGWMSNSDVSAVKSREELCPIPPESRERRELKPGLVRT